MKQDRAPHSSEHGTREGEDGIEEEPDGNPESEHVLEREQIDLLVRIQQLGSVVLAARALGISFRKAWDMVMAINSRSPVPLVYRMGAGTMDGVTLLSEEGKRLLTRETG